jgi:hypothetical protein
MVQDESQFTEAYSDLHALPRHKFHAAHHVLLHLDEL